MVPLSSGTVDKTGHVSGALKVIEYAGNDGHPNWLCECACGQAKCKGRVVVRGSELRGRRAVSCGALRSSPTIRRAARRKVPKRRRRAIARTGGKAGARARWGNGPPLPAPS
jgi:hypothetical protein